MLLLAVDAGSTQTKLGLFEGETLRFRARWDTDRGWVAGEWGAALGEFLDAAGVRPAEVDGVAVANVIAAVDGALRAGCEARLGRAPEFVGRELRSPLPLRYEPPASLGADRIANAVAAWSRHGAPVLVVDVGTAITFDAVSVGGEIAGGAILPGPLTALAALRARAPHLPEVEVAPPGEVIGGSTLACLQVGAYYGLLGQVEGIARRMKGALGETTPVIATGGLAPLLAEEPGLVDEVDADLTLWGIRILWEHCHSSH